jgi:hypothetical protein
MVIKWQLFVGGVCENERSWRFQYLWAGLNFKATIPKQD